VRSLAKAIYYPLFRWHLRLRLWCADRFRAPPPEGAVPPAMLRFRVSESLSVAEFLRVGEGCAKLIERHFHDMGMDLADARRVLDFGCGCGRTIRWFLREGGGAQWHGADVDAEAVDWCRRHLPPGRFLATEPVPPLPYPAEHFDAIYCLSVFTHLDESMQDLWLAELRRILKPQGVLLLTVFGPAAAGELDDEGREMLRSHGFVHRRSRKLRGIVPDWYHTSWHSREYILARLRGQFGDVRYHVIPDGRQDVVVARKTGS
jgi:SAM-dependent methyltransferase